MPGPRYVELLRVSSRGQAEKDTPEDQRRALDRLRASRPGVLVERIEQQVSGAADLAHRPDLQRLAALAAERAFDEVRVRHLDRLTRHADPGERSAILAMVYRARAVIVDAAGTVLDPRTMAGELVWVVQTLASAEERAKIAERTLGGKRRLAAEGRLVHGTPPWGRAFDGTTGRWSLTPDARHYRRLFDLALLGRSLWDIARQLEQDGVVSAKGRKWTGGMVYNLLRALHASGRYKSHGAAIQIPPIVDEVTQRAARAKLKSHDNSGGAHATIPALLRKVLRCGVCGSPMHTNRNSRRPGKPQLPAFYYCSSRGPCRKNHRIEDVDAAVRKRLREWLQRPLPLAIGAAGAPEGEDPEIVAQRVAKALRALDREEERLTRLTVRGVVSEKIGTQQLAELSQRRAALEREAEDARVRTEASERRAELHAGVALRVEEIRRGLGKAGFAEWREAVEILFPREGGYHVAIWPDGRIALRAAVTVGKDEELTRARGNRSRPSPTSWSIPVTLWA